LNARLEYVLHEIADLGGALGEEAEAATCISSSR